MEPPIPEEGRATGLRPHLHDLLSTCPQMEPQMRLSAVVLSTPLLVSFSVLRCDLPGAISLRSGSRKPWAAVGSRDLDGERGQGKTCFLASLRCGRRHRPLGSSERTLGAWGRMVVPRVQETGCFPRLHEGLQSWGGTPSDACRTVSSDRFIQHTCALQEVLVTLSALRVQM